MVHSRYLEVNGKNTTLEFGHEGMLYRQSFIMYDKQTDTKWNHSTGLAMSGKLIGRVLDFLPSRVMRWASWRALYPKTQVLAREGRFDFMGTYVADDHYGALGLSVGLGPQAKLFPFNALSKQPVVNDRVSPQDIVVTFDRENKQAAAFDRKIDARVLTFHAAKETRDNMPLMRDQETGSLWEAMSGRAVGGKLKGREILPVITVPWAIERWRQIYNKGIVYGQ